MLGKRESQTRQLFNFEGIYFLDFVVLKLLAVQNFSNIVENSENRQI